MQLHLFRHGQTNWNQERRVQGQSESHLTELGIQQAKELSKRIRHLKFDQVYCSSSVRTRQTADHAFADSDVPIEYLDSLREIDLGPWEGHLYDDIAVRDPDSFKHFWEQPHLFDVEGAETFYQLQQRAVGAVSAMLNKFDRRTVAIVSHGALIKSLLCHYRQRPISELWAPPNMHHCAHSIVDLEPNGSAYIVQYADQASSQENRR